MDVSLHATNMQNNSNLSEYIGAWVFFFAEHWTCLGMPNLTQRILHDLIKASMDFSLYGKK